ncbi:MAG: hypothetical protein AAGC57_20945 [Pseudomonadota bacterium]
MRAFVAIGLVFGWLLSAGGASTATAGLTGAFWQAGTFDSNTLAEAKGIGATRTPDAIFRATTLDYPQRLADTAAAPAGFADFLGTDAASVLSDTILDIPGYALGNNWVMRFTGLIETTPGDRLFEVRSDDGFELSTGSVVRDQVTRGSIFGPRTPVSVTMPAGPVSFEFIFYDAAAALSGLSCVSMG